MSTMEQNLILEQWNEKGWIWTEKDSLIATLETLFNAGISTFYLQLTPNGCFVRKVY